MNLAQMIPGREQCPTLCSQSSLESASGVSFGGLWAWGLEPLLTCGTLANLLNH